MYFRNQNLLVFPNVFAIWTHHLAVGHDFQTPRVPLAGPTPFFVSSKQEYFERFNLMESFMQFFLSPASDCIRFSHRSSASRFFTYLRFSTFLFITALIPTIFIGMNSSASAEQNGELKELPRAVLKHTPPLFEEWTFEKHEPAIFPPGFASKTLGDAPPGSWEIVTDENAPSRTHALLQSARCSHSPCFQLLITENIRMEYGDFSVRILSKFGTQNSGAGIVFGAQDVQNFYAVLIYPFTNTVKAFRVLNGQPTLIDEHVVVPQQTLWHFLRIQRNTIMSKELIEIFFDNHIILSLSDQSLGTGYIGLATTGDGVFAFDNFRVVELLTSRPLSRPPAY